jgi:hypothetical protein
MEAGLLQMAVPKTAPLPKVPEAQPVHYPVGSPVSFGLAHVSGAQMMPTDDPWQQPATKQMQWMQTPMQQAAAAVPDPWEGPAPMQRQPVQTPMQTPMQPWETLEAPVSFGLGRESGAQPLECRIRHVHSRCLYDFMTL